MAKLENIMDVSNLKHEDVEVNLSSGGVASVAVYDLEAMIMSLLTDKRLMNPENIAPGYDLFTGKSVGDVHHLGEFTRVMHGSPHIKDSVVMICTICS